MERRFCGGVLEAMNRFEAAVRADEMKGTQPPEEHNDIKQELDEARDELEDYLSQIY